MTTTGLDRANTAERDATVARSARVRKVGGCIQLAFAAFWLIRGRLTIDGTTGQAVALVGLLAVLTVLAFAVRSTAGQAGRPTGPQAGRIERSVTLATVAELVGSVVLPVVATATGHSDWVLPAVAVTIGALLLGTASAGFHDLSQGRPHGGTGTAALRPS